LSSMLICLILITNNHLLNLPAVFCKKALAPYIEEDPDGLIYDDIFITGKAASLSYNNQQQSVNQDINSNNPKPNIRHNHITSTIQDLDSYISQNQKTFKTNRLTNLISGSCLSSYLLSSAIKFNYIDSDPSKKYNTQENIIKLESLIDYRNLNRIYQDDQGNFLIASISVTSNIKTQFIYVSKLDFSFLVFHQTGDEIPILKDFMIGHVFLASQNKHIIYIFGGIDYKGSYSNDLFNIEVDYKAETATVRTFLSRNQKDQSQVPIGLTESSLSLISYQRSGENVEKVAVVLYGGLTDVMINEEVFIFTLDKGWYKVPDLNLPKLKGISTVVIVNENPNEFYGSINEVINKNSIYISGGRDDKAYNREFFKLELTYVVLDDSFFVKPIFLNVSNKNSILGRENHTLLFDKERSLRTKENYVYLIGGKNFLLNQFFDNEIYEINLKGSAVGSDGKQLFEWVRLPVKSKQRQIFSGFANNFYYDHFLNIDVNGRLKVILKNTSCKGNECGVVSLDTEVMREVSFGGEDSLVTKKSFRCWNTQTRKTNENSERTKGITSSLSIEDNKYNKTLNKSNTSKDNDKRVLTSNNQTNIDELNLFIEKKIKGIENDEDKLSIHSRIDESKAEDNASPDKQGTRRRRKSLHKQSKSHIDRIALKKQIEELLRNTTDFEEQLINKWIDSNKETNSKVKDMDANEALRFTQLKEIQTSSMKEVAESNIDHSESILKKALEKNEKQIQVINEDLGKAINNTKTEIEKETSRKMEELIKRIERAEKNSINRLESIAEKQDKQRELDLSQLEFRKKAMKCINGYLVGDNNENMRCICHPGFSGDDCSSPLTCDNDCNSHGECKLGKCFCHPGFKGKFCENNISCPNDCSNNGDCLYGKCFCDAEFIGEDCSEKLTCPKDCNSKGICFKGKCLCESGYFGETCENMNISHKPCNHNCSNNGICDLGKCFCYHGFTGESCEFKQEFSCPPFRSAKKIGTEKGEKANVDKSKPKKDGNRSLRKEIIIKRSKGKVSEKALVSKPCHGNGLCQYGKCFCYPGFKGVDCSEKYRCKDDCNTNGICIEENQCHCREGFGGLFCEVLTKLKENKFPSDRKAPFSNRDITHNDLTSFMQVEAADQLIENTSSHDSISSSNVKKRSVSDLFDQKEEPKIESIYLDKKIDHNNEIGKKKSKRNSFPLNIDESSNDMRSKLSKGKEKKKGSKMDKLYSSHSSVSNALTGQLIAKGHTSMNKKGVSTSAQKGLINIKCYPIIIFCILVLGVLTLLSVIFYQKI